MRDAAILALISADTDNPRVVRVGPLDPDGIRYSSLVARGSLYALVTHPFHFWRDMSVNMG